MTTFDSSEGVTWPALVWVAATDPSQARRIALLWRRALRAVNFSVHAQDVVTTWAERAAQAPVVVEPLGRLMRQTIEKPYEHDRFRTRLVWLRDRSDRPGIGDVARTLLGILVEAETAR